MPANSRDGVNRPVSFERERGVYDVVVTPDLALVVMTVGSEPDRTSRIQRIFRILAEQSIPIFLIKLHRSAVTFAVEASQIPDVQRCLAGVATGFKTRQDLSLLTIMASSMRDLTGVMVNLADSLQEADARLYGVGDSHNSVQCLIDGSRVPVALSRL